MIFGNREQFAIEAVLEPGPEFEPLAGGHLSGRIAIWLNGVRVGRLEEPACWFGPPCSELEELIDRLDDLWDDSFARLTPEEIFDLLDRVYFGAHRHRILDDLEEQSAGESPEVPDAWRFGFLTNSSEAFDGWKGFLVRPTSTTLMGLVLPGDSQEVAVSHFQTDTFRGAVVDFSQWLRDREIELIAKARQ